MIPLRFLADCYVFQMNINMIVHILANNIGNKRCFLKISRDETKPKHTAEKNQGQRRMRGRMYLFIIFHGYYSIVIMTTFF